MGEIGRRERERERKGGERGREGKEIMAGIISCY